MSMRFSSLLLLFCCAGALPGAALAQLVNSDFSALRAEYGHLEVFPGWTPLLDSAAARFVVETLPDAAPGDRHANVGYFSSLTNGFGANKLDRCITVDRSENLSLSLAVRTRAAVVSNDLRVRINPNFYSDLATCEQDIAADTNVQRLAGVNANLDWDLRFGDAAMQTGVWFNFEGIEYPSGQTPADASVIRVSLRARDSGTPSAGRRVEFGPLSVGNGTNTVNADFARVNLAAGRPFVAGVTGTGWVVDSGVLQAENDDSAVAGPNVVGFPELTTAFGANRIDQCVALPRYTDFGAALSVRSNDPHPDLGLRVNARFFSDENCLNQVGSDLEYDFALDGAADVWHLLETPQRAWAEIEDAGATHARLSLRSRNRSAEPRSFQFDSAFVPGGLVLAPPPGQYDTPQLVTLGAIDGGLFARYTLDGSPPTAASPLVVSGISIGTSSILSIRLFDANGEPVGGVQRAHYQLDVSGAPSFDGLEDGVALSGVVGDATDPLTNNGLTFAVSDALTAAEYLVVEAFSSNPAVVPDTALEVVNDNGSVTLRITPVGVGFANITVQVTNSNDLINSRIIRYAASAHTTADIFTRWYTGRADASAAINLGGGLFMVFDDEGDHRLEERFDNAIHIHDLAASGAPLASLSVDDELGLFDNTSNCNITGLTGVAACNSDGEVDYEAAVRIGHRLYITGSHSNNGNGRSRADRWRFFSADLVGSGTATTLNVNGYYRWLREDLRAWDAANAHGFGADYFGLVASSAGGDPDPAQAPESPNLNGFSIEGLTLSPDETRAWLGFRAPLVAAPGAPAVTPNNVTGRTHALIIPVLNFGAIASAANGGNAGSAQIGMPIRLDLGGRGVREVTRNDAGQYLIIAGPSANATGIAPQDFRLYTWDGSVDSNGAATNLILRPESLAAITAPAFAGSPEGIISLPEDLDAGGEVYILSDAGDVDYYADGLAAKALENDAHKKFRVDRVLLGSMPAAGQCGLASGTPSLIAPSTGLCAAGNAGNLLSSAGQHTWACAGVGGGANAQCRAPGLTGPSSGVGGGVGGGSGPGSGGQVTAAFDGHGCELDSIELVAPPAGGPAGVAMPFGVLNFALSGCTGAGVDVTLTYSTSVDGMSYWKYIDDVWVMMPAVMSGNTASFTIEDNGPFDADPIPGRIADPSGPGVLGFSVPAIPVMSPLWVGVLVSLLSLLTCRSRVRRKPV